MCDVPVDIAGVGCPATADRVRWSLFDASHSWYRIRAKISHNYLSYRARGIHSMTLES